MAKWKYVCYVLCVTLISSTALDIDEVNPLVVQAEYAVRGMILDRATAIEAELRDDTKRTKWPFDKVVLCNIGNPQALGQSPPAFARKVLSVVLNPTDLLDTGEAKRLYGEEVSKRAERYVNAIPGGVGAYSESRGLKIVREEVAAFIEKRDGGHEADVDSIFLTDGASAGAKHLLTLLLRGPGDALLAPAPMYPLYSALAALSNASVASYYLDELNDWSTNVEELERAYDASVRDFQATPRAIVVINPGNPTGATLSQTALEDVVRFCQRKKLVLLADEVYQENVYGSDAPPFISFKKVVRDLGAHDVALVSFHSISKGFTGECGLRGGYFELCNFHSDVVNQLVKLASLALCSNVPGQVAVGLMVNPPVFDAKDQYILDKSNTLNSLHRRSKKIADALDSLPGVTCPQATGALYLFPNVVLPKRAVAAAAAKNLQPDAFYALNLLERTGLVVVPGSGFGQREGTFHFRTTFLPPEDDIDGVLARLEDFHRGFLAQFNDDDDDVTSPRDQEL